MGELEDLIDDVIRGIGRTLEGIQKETVEGLVSYTWLFALQAILDDLVKPYGFLVDITFVGYTLYCLYQEFQATITAKSIVRFFLALFVLGFDIYLNLAIH